MIDLSRASESPPIEFELTEPDMRVLMAMSVQRTYRLDQPAVSRSTRRWAAAIVIVSFGTLFVMLLNASRWNPSLWSVGIPLMLGCGAASKLTDNRAARRKAADRRVDQIMQSSLTVAQLGRYTFRLTADGLEHTGPLEARAVRWPGIHCFRAYNGFVFISLGWEVLSIPAHAFDGVGGAQAFADFGNRRLAEEGVGSTKAMIDYLSSHSVKCRRCGYNLRGTTNLVCPECSRPIEMDDVPDAWLRR